MKHANQNVIIALVGQANVGKSTLFNALTHTRQALVAPQSGMTRDRRYGVFSINGMSYHLIDTGGVTSLEDQAHPYVMEQTFMAIEQAHLIYYLLDARVPITSIDLDLSTKLRKTGKRMILVLSKADQGKDLAWYHDNLAPLGYFEHIIPVAAMQRKGIKELLEATMQILPSVPCAPPVQADVITCAIVGKANVGKSTLINKILGHKRMSVCDRPGTTTDSIAVPFHYQERDYLLIDTAGIRQKSKIDNNIEKLAAVRSCESIDLAQVIIVVIDGTTSLTAQDLRLLNLCFALKKRIVVIAINKCDEPAFLLQREHIVSDIKRRFGSLSQSFIHFISAAKGYGVLKLLTSVKDAYDHMVQKVPTHKVTTFLNELITARTCKHNHYPIKLKYAHIGGHNPLTIVIHGNKVEHLSSEYKKYLENKLRLFLKLNNIPLCLEFKSSHNPYAVKRKSGGRNAH